jgi:chemotaxis protein methyltransferase CheR
MEKQTFEAFRQLVYTMSGISLGPQKEALVSARVAKRMRALDIPTHEDYVLYVKKDKSGQEIIHLIDAISTNVTSFFREPEHFDCLRDLLTRWRAKGQRRYRIWCAASSSGEEPYTIAMTALETLGTAMNLRVLATDISTRILEQARTGRYDEDKMRGVAPILRDRYFSRVTDDGKVRFEAKPQLKELILFRRLNLAEPPFPMKGPLDVVFCRNVMIYFDKGVRSRLVGEVRRLLKPEGYLLVGHAESLTGLGAGFKTVQPSVYMR